MKLINNLLRLRHGFEEAVRMSGEVVGDLNAYTRFELVSIVELNILKFTQPSPYPLKL